MPELDHVQSLTVKEAEQANGVSWDYIRSCLYSRKCLCSPTALPSFIPVNTTRTSRGQPRQAHSSRSAKHLQHLAGRGRVIERRGWHLLGWAFGKDVGVLVYI